MTAGLKKLVPKVPVAAEHENHDAVDFSHSYWLGFLASALMRVLRAKTHGEARMEARKALGSLSDHHVGLRDVSPEQRREWREAAAGEEQDE